MDDLIAFLHARLEEDGLLAPQSSAKAYVLGYDVRSPEGKAAARQLALRYADHPDYREEWRP